MNNEQPEKGITFADMMRECREKMYSEQPDDSNEADVFLSVPPNMNRRGVADILGYCLNMYQYSSVSFSQGALDLHKDYVDNTISLVVTRENLKNANVIEFVEYVRTHYSDYAVQLSID